MHDDRGKLAAPTDEGFIEMSRQPDPSEAIRDAEQLYERFGISQNSRQFDVPEQPRFGDQHAYNGSTSDYFVVYEHRLSHNTHTSNR